MKKFYVSCTQIWNGVMEVEANSKEEAMSKAQEQLGDDFDCINWSFGEATADYVEEI